MNFVTLFVNNFACYLHVIDFSCLGLKQGILSV